MTIRIQVTERSGNNGNGMELGCVTVAITKGGKMVYMVKIYLRSEFVIEDDMEKMKNVSFFTTVLTP